MMRVIHFARHGLSASNVAGVVSGNADRCDGLAEEGIAQARQLGDKLAGLGIELCVSSPFPRARQTAALAVGDRGIPVVLEPDLGDVRIGDLDGLPIAEYRADPARSDRARRFPGGESLDEATLRFAKGLERLVERSERSTLVVTHEVVIRCAVNAAIGSEDLEHPVESIAHACLYAFDEPGLRRALDRIAASTSRP